MTINQNYGLYLHIPFCASKCAYCDFLSFPGDHTAWKDQYVRALCAEIEARLSPNWQDPTSIFIGGGTPTSLSLEHFSALFASLTKGLSPSAKREFTIEVNPGSLTEELLEVFKKAGVNRLSIGAQSFDNEMLKCLGRGHSREDIIESVSLARLWGFHNINLDLIYGLPGQSLAHWQASLKEALSLEPEHLSCYQLIVEEGTKIARQLDEGSLPSLDPDLGADAWLWQIPYLQEQGYWQYEISNYAKEGYESKHNSLYWDLDNYLGLGLGATSWYRPKRRENTSDIRAYCQAWQEKEDAPYEEERLSREDQMLETMIMGLRLNRGVSCRSFRQRYGKSVEETYGAVLSMLEGKKLVQKNKDNWSLTDQGRMLGNLVFEAFL